MLKRLTVVAHTWQQRVLEVGWTRARCTVTVIMHVCIVCTCMHGHSNKALYDDACVYILIKNSVSIIWHSIV